MKKFITAIALTASLAVLQTCQTARNSAPAVQTQTVTTDANVSLLREK